MDSFKIKGPEDIEKVAQGLLDNLSKMTPEELDKMMDDSDCSPLVQNSTTVQEDENS